MPVLSPIHCPWPSKLLSNKKRVFLLDHAGVTVIEECWRAPEYSGMLALVFDWIITRAIIWLLTISMRNHSKALTKDLPEICQQNQTCKQSTATLFSAIVSALDPREFLLFSGRGVEIR